MWADQKKFLALALLVVAFMGGCIPSPLPRPAEHTATPIPPGGPSGLECPSFTAFGGLPIPLPIPVPVPGADVQGSPSPVSSLARAMDEALRRAFQQAALRPQYVCFFEIRIEGQSGAFAVYQFSAELGPEAGNRLAEALRGQGIRVGEPGTLTSPGGSILWMELGFPDGAGGGLLGMRNMIWAWVAPEVRGAVEETPEPTSYAPPPPAPTEAPPTVQPAGLAQDADAALRPALEKALGVRLNLTDFAAIGGAGTLVFLTYRPEGTFSLADRGDRLQQELTRVGLSISAIMVSEDEIGIFIQGGRLGDRIVNTGTISVKLDSVGVTLEFP
ncbi:MAG TPA: hypothetical protein VNK89_01250 [Thermoflexus sp.]|nr:hypothetical protein [Thermoflexus sp.]